MGTSTTLNTVLLICAAVSLTHRSTTMDNITITAYNMRTLRGASAYVNVLMDSSDIMILSEHRLYNSELYKLKDLNSNYEYHSKASSDLDDSDVQRKPGHCGISLCWKRDISHKVRVINNPSDRICIIEVIKCLQGKSLFILGVYLPQQGCTIASFDKHIEILQDQITILKERGYIMIMGDMNSHFGDGMGSRCWGSTTANGKKMYDLICKQNLNIVDITALCNGPSYTFHVDGVGTSYIDHCAISSDLLQCVTCCKVHQEHYCNHSDHLPLSITLQNIQIPIIEKLILKKIRWNKLANEVITQKYTLPLEEVLKTEVAILVQDDVEIASLTEIEDYIDKVTNAMIKCAKKLSSTNKRRGEKAYWNKDLSEHRRTVKSLWLQWVEQERPRGDDPLYLKYKRAKKDFRHVRHQAEIKYEQEKIKDLCHSQDMDIKFFWHLVNKHKKGSHNQIYPIRLSKDVIICEPNEIRQCWKSYFKSLFTPNTNDCSFDSDFKDRIDEKVETFLVESNQSVPKDNFEKYTHEDIKKLIENMKLKKAPGYDGIQPEHIKYGGDVCITVLKNLVNSICLSENIPHQFKIGVIIPLPKAGKDRIIQDNNRGITLQGTVAKLYDKAILQRIQRWAKENNLIHELQGACQEKCSSLHTNWLVRESVAHYMERGSTVYVALLDVAKAFDTVWHNGLFYMLHENGMDKKLWRLLIKSYDGFRCCVSIGGQYSEFFEALQGLHQGAPISMTGFALYDNILIKALVQCMVGLQLGDTDVTCPAYADDIVVLTTNVATLQVLLNKVHEFSRQWRLKFNAAKCAIVVYGKDKNPDFNLTLGSNPIKRKDGHTHLGTLLSPHKACAAAHIRSRITDCKKPAYAISAIGSRKAPVTPKSASHVYETVCLPKLLYGLEVTDIPDTSVIELESFHASVAKTIQVLPDQCANVGAIKSMGWITVRGLIDIARLLFLWRLILLPMSNIYKKVLVYRYVHLTESHSSKCQGPLQKMLEAANKYSLSEIVNQGIELGEKMSMSSWKKMVKSIVYSNEQRMFQISCRIYPSLYQLIACTPNVEMSSWWKFVQEEPYMLKKCKDIMRLLLGCHKLNSCTYKYSNNDIQNAMCTKCMFYEVESVSHFLFKCTMFEDIRAEQWSNIIANCPTEAMKEDILAMSSEQRTTYLLSGLRNSYIPEWKPMFDAIATYVNAMYKERCKLP